MMAAHDPGASPAGAEVLRLDPKHGERLRIAIRGRLDTSSRARAWSSLFRIAPEGRGGQIVVDLGALDWCDAGGAVLLAELEQRQRATGGSVVLEGVSDDVRGILELVRPEQTEAAKRAPTPQLVERVGRSTLEWLGKLNEHVSFIGHLTLELFRALRHPGSVRLSDTFRVAEAVGIGAIPIVALVGGLLGLILGFQSVISMKRFGAEIYMADLLAISMLRELGPLMGAILLAARSGSAFAAEIGTMKVNEEVDALTTMGLEPVRFLIVPRMLAGLAMMPVVAMLTNFFGMLGGLVVWLGIGYPTVTFVKRAASAATMVDLFGGLSKAIVFGVIVAAVGCLRGLETGKGAGAVGESTTSSVVTCIVLIGIADGIFAVVFYVLGI